MFIYLHGSFLPSISLFNFLFFFPFLSPSILSYLTSFCYSLLSFFFYTLRFSFPVFSPSSFFTLSLMHDIIFFCPPLSFTFFTPLSLPLSFSSSLSLSFLLSFQFPSMFPVLPFFSSCLLPLCCSLFFPLLLCLPHTRPPLFSSPLSLCRLSLTPISSWY